MNSLVLLINIPLFLKKCNFIVQSFMFFSTLVKDLIFKPSKHQYVLLSIKLLSEKVTSKSVIKSSDLFWLQYYLSYYSNYILDLNDIQIKL